MRKNFLIFSFLFIILLLTIYNLQKITHFFSKAKEEKINIIVNPLVNQGPLTPIWQALSQGGEEEKYPFENTLPEITTLKPKYIRIDHIYDFYNVVQKENNQLKFSWEQLDKLVNQVLATGSLPFFSLSYMPPAIAKNGEITNLPENWQDWSEVVRQTIQHYSGKDQKNLSNVIYEVWNEPDLFGNWRIGGKKDYRLLYKYAALGANQVQNTNPFKIGGPAITAPYKNWVDGFLDFVSKNNLRIDFYSWHRYSLQPEKFLEDINKVDTWLFKNGGISLEKYLTEWGPSSEISPINESTFAGTHTVATIRQLIQRVDFAFTFEIKGRWGILTKEGEFIRKSPRYYALDLLNNMTGTRISLEGENNWITGFASKENNKIKVILANLDVKNQHYETFPLTIINLENGNYLYRKTFLGKPKDNYFKEVVNNTFQEEISLLPNSVVLIELEKI
jgi:hypothetical protein